MRYEPNDYEWTAIKPMLPNKPRGSLTPYHHRIAQLGMQQQLPSDCTTKLTELVNRPVSALLGRRDTTATSRARSDALRFELILPR
jgi:hypothetical protein